MSITVTHDYDTTALTKLKALQHLAFPHIYLWATAAAMFLINALWIALSDRISIVPSWFNTYLVIFALAALLILARAVREKSIDWFLHRVWGLSLTLLFSFVLLGNLMVLNHLLMSIVFPMADDLLLSWDRALGFDWLAYSKALTSYPVVHSAIRIAYFDMTYAGVATIAVILICMNQRVRLIELAFLLTSAALFCLVFAIGFPANGTMWTLGDAELLSRLQFGDGSNFVEQLALTRGTAPRHLVPAELQGLASFPSFHTCLGMIILYCSRGHMLTGTFGKAVAIAIIAGTPIFGGHYFVDLISGGCLMMAAIWVWKYKIAHRVENIIPGTPDYPITIPKFLQASHLK